MATVRVRFTDRQAALDAAAAFRETGVYDDQRGARELKRAADRPERTAELTPSEFELLASVVPPRMAPAIARAREALELALERDARASVIFEEARNRAAARLPKDAA